MTGRSELASYWLILFLMIAAQFASSAASAEPATDPREALVLFSLKKPAPVIDGTLDDSCWQGAQTATGFMPLSKIAAAEVETQVMSCYDEQNLYFAVRAKEPHLDKLVVKPAVPYDGDCIEIFLDPENTRQAYHQFIIDSAGNVAVIRQGAGATPMNFAGTCKTGTAEGQWHLEIAIPLQSLGAEVPKDNQKWGFNVGRERYAAPPRQLSSWAALNQFSQKDKFGTLAFFSEHEVQAILSYWRNTDRHPLLGRPEVSGLQIFSTGTAGAETLPTLWRYDPFAPDREKNSRWNTRGMVGGGETGYPALKDTHPEFYRAAMGLNRALVERSYLDEALAQLNKVVYYVRVFKVTSSVSAKADELQKRCVEIDEELNSIYQMYGRAFNADYDQAQLSGIEQRIAAVEKEIADLREQVSESSRNAAASASASRPWTAPALKLPDEASLLNEDGADRRISFAGMRFYGHEEVVRLVGQFDSINIDWPYVVPEMPGPGQFLYKELDKHISWVERYSPGLKINIQTLYGSQYWAPFPAHIEEQAKSDPDMILISQDGLRPERNPQWHQGLNPNNANALAFAEEYLANLGAHLKDRAHFFVTGWEDLNIIQIGPEASMRSIGYNESNKTSFRNYLRERYEAIEQLNGKWKTQYPSFDAIEPPADKFLTPATVASGLTYEFERWLRVNHARYNANQRRFLKKGAPNVPVMIDDSNFLIDMNGYYLMKENAADFYSFHSSPGNEEMMWTSLGTLARKYGKILGYHENYWDMYRNVHMADERLAKRDVRKFFFNLYSRDVRLSTWWLTYLGQKTDYIVAYGGGFFGLDYDQTIFRWSSTELAPMFQRGRQIEKALVESHPYPTKAAILQPLATVVNLASMGRTYRDSPPVLTSLAVFNQATDAWNIPCDFIPDEMILDGKASLDEYGLLLLPNAVYMNQEVAKQLIEWTRRGGTLVSVGPSMLANEFGEDLPAELSPLRQIFPDARRTGAGGWDFEAGAKLPGIDPRITSQRLDSGTFVFLNREVEAYVRDKDLSSTLRRVLTRAAQVPAETAGTDLDVLVRQSNDGHLYLCVGNRNVERTTAATITLMQPIVAATDVVVPGGFAVPFEVRGNRTAIQLQLDPGDFTLVRLDLPASKSAIPSGE